MRQRALSVLAATLALFGVPVPAQSDVLRLPLQSSAAFVGQDRNDAATLPKDLGSGNRQRLAGAIIGIPGGFKGELHVRRQGALLGRARIRNDRFAVYDLVPGRYLLELRDEIGRLRAFNSVVLGEAPRTGRDPRPVPVRPCEITSTGCDLRGAGEWFPCDRTTLRDSNARTDSGDRAICICKDGCSGVELLWLDPETSYASDFLCYPCRPRGDWSLCCRIAF